MELTNICYLCNSSDKINYITYSISPNGNGDLVLAQNKIRRAMPVLENFLESYYGDVFIKRPISNSRENFTQEGFLYKKRHNFLSSVPLLGFKSLSSTLTSEIHTYKNRHIPSITLSNMGSDFGLIENIHDHLITLPGLNIADSVSDKLYFIESVLKY